MNIQEEMLKIYHETYKWALKVGETPSQAQNLARAAAITSRSDFQAISALEAGE